MRVDHIPEPELEFGSGRHVDIRFGLMDFGPFDQSQRSRPQQIKLGIVGSNDTVEKASAWLEWCRTGIPAKFSRRPNLFPRFPGFNSDVSFRSDLLTESRLSRIIQQQELTTLLQAVDPNVIIAGGVDLFLREISYITENMTVDVILCALPAELLAGMEGGAGTLRDGGMDNGTDESVELDFHDLLKAKAMKFRKPLQLILPSTYGESDQRVERFRRRQLQDEATRAWNLHTALYYKAGGLPWRMLHDPVRLSTCYVGVSFYRSLDQTQLLTSIAQVFDERGYGIIVRGGPVALSKQDRQPHLSEADAYSLLRDALQRYRQEHRTFPARIVVHKTSAHGQEEVRGFTEAGRSAGIDSVELLSFVSSSTRLLRVGAYPPLRGTLLVTAEGPHLLYTKGSVDFFATYPGMYVPRALEMRCAAVEQTPRFLAKEVLELTKMNWNTTQFDNADPITIRAARQVGAVLKYVGPDDLIESRYSYYM